MIRSEQGFSLVELIVVIIMVGILSIGVSSRFSDTNSTSVQTGRDDIIAALFFAQQTAMARDGIEVNISGNSVSVLENGTPISIHSDAYPLTLPAGVTVTAAPTSFSYNKLGKTTGGSIRVERDGVWVTITVEASGYAHY